MLVLILLVLPVFTSAQLRPPQEMATDLFYDVDYHTDGMITRAEVDLYYEHYDTNSNGEVSHPEFDTYISTHYDYLIGHIDQMFDMFDGNDDGRLNAYDFDNLFHQADMNGDGLVAEGEFIPYFTAVFSQLG